jgi:glycosyltransferase involved in cell wall biosynthesis
MPASVPKSTPAGLADVAGMRILGFCDWYTPLASGGAERAAWEIYRRLGAAGADVRVVSATHGPPHEDPGVSVREVRGLDLTKLIGGYFAPSPGSFPAARRELAAQRSQVLHANTIHHTGSAAAAWISRRTGVPLVVTAQLGSLDHMPARARVPGNAYERTVGAFVLRRASRVLAVSEAVREHVIARGADPERVSVAPNGVDHERFGMQPITPSGAPGVVAIGRLTDNKGPDLLVEAAGMLAAEGLEFSVTFVGDGPMRTSLTERVRELGVQDKVRFAGQVSDVEAWLERSQIVVRPSYTEGLALAILEAMAAGRCNVVSDIPPNRELIDDGRTGLTFRSGDAADLAETLRRVIAEPQLRAELARAAQTASAAYTWERMAALHADAFSEVVAERSR